jgi:hypothetical protein
MSLSVPKPVAPSITVDTSVAIPDVGSNVSATSPAAVDSKDSTPKLLIGAANRGHDRSSLVDCTNASAAATANTSVSIMLSTFIDSPDKAAMHQSSSSTCRSINISSLSTGGGVNNSQFSVSTQQAQSLDQQHKATNTSEMVVASSPACIAPCLSPVTPQEEIVKRQRYLKDWLGKLKDRGMSHTTASVCACAHGISCAVEMVDARANSVRPVVGHNATDLMVPTELLLISQLLLGDIFISGSLKLHNQSSEPVEVEIAFSTDMLRVLNNESNRVVIDPSSKLE